MRSQRSLDYHIAARGRTQKENKVVRQNEREDEGMKDEKSSETHDGQEQTLYHLERERESARNEERESRHGIRRERGHTKIRIKYR